MNAPDQVVEAYKKANDTDAYEKTGEVEAFFDQSLPLKRVVVASGPEPGHRPAYQERLLRLVPSRRCAYRWRAGLHSASTPYQGYSMDQAPLSSANGTPSSAATQDGIRVIGRSEDRFSHIKTPGGEYLQTWFEYLPDEVAKDRPDRDRAPGSRQPRRRGRPRQFIEEIGLLPLAGRSASPWSHRSIRASARCFPNPSRPGRIHARHLSRTRPGARVRHRVFHGRSCDPEGRQRKTVLFAAAVPMAAALHRDPGTSGPASKARLPIMFTTSSFELGARSIRPGAPSPADTRLSSTCSSATTGWTR